MDLKDREVYIIENTTNNLSAQWGEEVILFDTEEDAKEMVSLFPDFFKPSEIKIKKVIMFADYKIKYDDLKQRKDFIEALKGEDNNG